MDRAWSSRSRGPATGLAHLAPGDFALAMEPVNRTVQQSPQGLADQQKPYACAIGACASHIDAEKSPMPASGQPRFKLPPGFVGV
jgi:hypothetical protein